jgi:hypothetical protein
MDTLQQMAELLSYASGQDMPRPTLFRNWSEQRPYEWFIPPDATTAQQQHFMMGMDKVLTPLLARRF